MQLNKTTIIITTAILLLTILGAGCTDTGGVNPATTTYTPPLQQKTSTNSIGMEFILIPAGSFEMGFSGNEDDRLEYEGVAHKVKIPKNFYMGKYEVTQKQWREVMGNNPSVFTGDDRPVEQVSWDDVQEFIKKLNEKEDTDKYRLPSEAEWEYAARAGTTTRFFFGELDGSNLCDEYAWYHGNSDLETHPVGQKIPNPWGLYDIHGNVWEWVQDEWHVDYNDAPSDNNAWEDGSSSSRVLRGGSWSNNIWSCGSAFRYGDEPDLRLGILGFRLLQES